MSIKVLFLTRENSHTLRGGDVMSLEQTICELESLDIHCAMSNDPQADLAPYDIVHIYNLELPTSALAYLVNARRQNKRLVVTPIYWRHQYWDELADRRRGERPVFDVTTMNVHTPARRALTQWLDEQADLATEQLVLDACERVFAKSEMERALLAQDFAVPPERTRITYNGIDEQFSRGVAERFVAKYHVRDFVLCVARVETRKNILGLIRAWRNESVPLVIIGSAPNALYLEQCRAEASDNVHFLEPMSPPELADAYAAARVHVLASWWEEMGRVALEAAMAGCALVMTQNSPAREYFQDDCFLCDPADTTAIRSAMYAALDAPRAPHLAARLQTQFTWKRAAQVLAQSYQELTREPARPLASEYATRLMHIAALRAETLYLRELHYRALENHARELRGWMRELERNRPVRGLTEIARRARQWLKRQ